MGAAQDDFIADFEETGIKTLGKVIDRIIVNKRRRRDDWGVKGPTVARGHEFVRRAGECRNLRQDRDRLAANGLVSKEVGSHPSPGGRVAAARSGISVGVEDADGNV